MDINMFSNFDLLINSAKIWSFSNNFFFFMAFYLAFFLIYIKDLFSNPAFTLLIPTTNLTTNRKTTFISMRVGISSGYSLEEAK